MEHVVSRRETHAPHKEHVVSRRETHAPHQNKEHDTVIPCGPPPPKPPRSKHVLRRAKEIAESIDGIRDT